MTRYEQTKNFILEKLKTGIPETLFYHSVGHVLDVLSAAEMLGKNEKIIEPEMELLRVAVLFHDSGHMVSAKNHEQIGCDIAKAELPRFGYNEKEIEIICGMILATRYPQKPNNLLEQIICDADLDYLGRDDFFPIGNKLFAELEVYGIVRDALSQGHTGSIRLYHGSRNPEGLYLIDELRALASQHENFTYTPCVSGALPAENGYATGRAPDVAMADIPKLNGWRIFLCGNPDMVKTTKKKAFLTGAAMKDIYADAFTLAAA